LAAGTIGVAAALCACAPHRTSTPTGSTRPPTASGPNAAPEPARPEAPPPGSASTPAIARPEGVGVALGAPCGALGCRAFPSPEAAFEYVLQTKPALLAIGEAHAQKGSEAVVSTTRRFSEQFLPRLRGRARDLVVELLVPDARCQRKTVEHVAEQQRPVTQPQAESNQNEFLELAKHAKALGIQPHPLYPSCAELEAISAAGANDVELMLETVAKASLRTLSALLEHPPPEGSPSLILAYGGAMHNDLAPRADRERWSFGPALSARTPAYVELDLIVPEYVKDSDTWRAFPWYADFVNQKSTSLTLLYQPRPSSFVLIFPRSAP
jgi:hypothetical protein